MAERAAFGSVRAAADLGVRRLRMVLAVLLIWALIAFALSLQGYLTARSAGRDQDWWPSFGYSLAIFSIWAGLFSVTRRSASNAPITRPCCSWRRCACPARRSG